MHSTIARAISFSLLASAGFLSAGVLSRITPHAAADEPYAPRISPASNQGEQAISRIVVPDGFKVELWAAEPLLANPVAFCFDEKGRMFVAETFRQKKGVEDNRDHMRWLDDDLAAMTVEDRLAYFKKHLGDNLQSYTKEQDRIRLLEDRNGDGKADTATVFADGFNDVLEGTGAGLLARRGNVWYTNIPNLWMLGDENGDGKADSKKALHYGFGVRVAFRGHDMHGLRLGPDGRLYFSIGDRGLNVTTMEGKRLVYPDRGSVLRCNLDGTELEIVATGLRNPQELAFDQYGNLFTGDNNSDSGDRARWVYLVDGGDSGWRMHYQYLRDRGPWNREKLWHPQHEGQAAYLVPPVANVSDGPSGLTYNPGTGFPEKHAGHFFLADFRGTPRNSGIRSFAVKPKGAGFELVDSTEFAWSILATDVDFGPDGAMYVSDWVEGWDGPGKGRIYKITADSQQNDPRVAEVRRLIGEGFTHRSLDELTALLAHPNMQVRMESQFALVERGAEGHKRFEAVSSASPSQLARLHAVWGLGQLARSARNESLAQLRKLSNNAGEADSEVRAQVAKVLGEAGDAASADRLIALLRDAEPRVRFFAALSLGRLGAASRVAPLVELLRENADRDAYLRHAAVMSLARTPHQKDVLAAGSDPSAAVRMGVLVALRRQGSGDVARFLADAEPRLVDEAARAINDVPIDDGLPRLAVLAGRGGLSEPTLWRVINANYRLGKPENAAALAALAARADVPEALRIEALSALETWGAPSNRDRVLGSWRPLAPREVQIAVQAFRGALAGIMGGTERVRRTAIPLAAKMGITEVAAVLFDALADKQVSPQTRLEAVKALSELKSERLGEAIAVAMKDPSPLVRAEGRRALSRREPAAALGALSAALETGEIVERQEAYATLGELQSAEADALLAQGLEKLSAGTLPIETQLDLLDAAGRRGTPELLSKIERIQASGSAEDPLTPFRVALAGGDAERGRRIFFERSEVSCVRCHKVQDVGGEVGPDLSKIGAQQKRDYLLESLVLPDKQIAKGFDPVVIVTDRGKVYSGIIRQDDGREIRLITADGNTVVIPKSQIDEQTRGKSAMPEDVVKKLTKSEVRDLLEFLANLK